MGMQEPGDAAEVAEASKVPDPGHGRPRSRWLQWPVAIVLVLAVGISAVAAVTVTRAIIDIMSCDTPTWKDAAASEVEALAPPDARSSITTNYECEDHVYTRFDVGDTTAALKVMNEKAQAGGWRVPLAGSSASAPCLEGNIDGQPTIMLIESNAPNTVSLESWTGTCDNS